jgi:hypothetical protein
MTAATKPTVFEALSAAMDEVQAVGKGDRNNEQGYSFRGIDAVVNAVGPVFRKHGIVPVPVKVEASYRDVLTSREKRSRECTVTVTYRFYGPAGDFIEAQVPGESMDFGDKGAPKAMSVAYRILLLQTLCIPTHEPEPDAQTYERAREDAGPSAKQTAAYDELSKQIAAAESQAGLKVGWDMLVAAYKADEITTQQANELKAAMTARKVELEARGDGTDSTGDGDGGSAQPGPPGSGPGPDGEGVGERRPGGDGEAAGARAGVQSGLPEGRGVDRAAQAPGGRRGAPAQVGGRGE